MKKMKHKSTRRSRDERYNALPFGARGPCARLSACQACPLLPLSPHAQRDHKLASLRERVERSPVLRKVPVELSPDESQSSGYRHTAKPAVRSGARPETLAIGLYRRGSHDLIDLGECWVQSPRINELLRALRELAPLAGFRGYQIGDETCVSSASSPTSSLASSPSSSSSVLRYVVAREGYSELDASDSTRPEPTPALYLTLIVTALHEDQLTALITALHAHCPALLGVGVHINRSSGNAIFDLSAPTRHVWGVDALSILIDDPLGLEPPLTLRVSAPSFTQVNPEVAGYAYRALTLALDPRPGERALDLYCGVGAIGLMIARLARDRGGSLDALWGLEESSSSIEDARANAMSLGYTEASFERGRAEDTLPRLVSQLDITSGPPLIVALNPSRRGCQPEVLVELARLKPRRIAYMSCEAKTLVRDLERLSKHGYETRSLTLFDMFPGSTHYETVAILEPAQA